MGHRGQDRQSDEPVAIPCGQESNFHAAHHTTLIKLSSGCGMCRTDNSKIIFKMRQIFTEHISGIYEDGFIILER